MCRLKHFRTATITHKIFETYSSFHVKQRITGKVYFLFFKGFLLVLTLFRMAGGGQKGPPTSFSPTTSTNVGISSQNFLTFSCNLFATLI